MAPLTQKALAPLVVALSLAFSWATPAGAADANGQHNAVSAVAEKSPKTGHGGSDAPTSSSPFTLEWDQLAAGIAAVGSLGVAAFGLVESLGKSFAFSIHLGRRRHAFDLGLPYVGLGIVKKMIDPLSPALAVAYGNDFIDVIAQQYRSDRASGRAPDTIRQGVRLGLPFLDETEAGKVISSVWEMPEQRSLDLARALQAPPSASPAPNASTSAPSTTAALDPVQALAGRFATALDARVNAAFDLAEEQYEAWAKLLAAFAAVALSVFFNYGLGKAGADFWHHGLFPFPLALVIGAVAVPLAPVAKDVSTSLESALTAFKAIPSRSI